MTDIDAAAAREDFDAAEANALAANREAQRLRRRLIAEHAASRTASRALPPSAGTR